MDDQLRAQKRYTTHLLMRKKFMMLRVKHWDFSNFICDENYPRIKLKHVIFCLVQPKKVCYRVYV